MTRKPWGDAFGTVTEQEAGLLRPRFAFLMGLTLKLLLIVHYTQASLNSFSDSFNTDATYLAIFVANNCFWDIQNVFFSIVLIAMFDSGIKVSQLRRYGSTANAWQGGTNVNTVAMNCIVGFLVNLAIARIIVLTLWDGEDTGWWPQFSLDQVRIFIDVILAIYYTVVAILMCT